MRLAVVEYEIRRIQYLTKRSLLTIDAHRAQLPAFHAEGMPTAKTAVVFKNVFVNHLAKRSANSTARGSADHGLHEDLGDMTKDYAAWHSSHGAERRDDARSAEQYAQRAAGFTADIAALNLR